MENTIKSKVYKELKKQDGLYLKGLKQLFTHKVKSITWKPMNEDEYMEEQEREEQEHQITQEPYGEGTRD